jgi:glucosylceramidase
MSVFIAPTSHSDGASESDWKVFIDDRILKQRIDGFGAAWTDASVTCLDSLSPASRQHVMSLLFGLNESIQLNLMRHTIGQSDLTPSFEGEWSYDSNHNQPDPLLVNFSLTEPGQRMFQYLLQMRTIDPTVKLFGSTWSPPQWMKTADNSVDIIKYGEAWTDYMLAYLTAFAENGVPVNALTLQNEPLHSQDPAWTTLMPASDQATLLNMLGPKLRTQKNTQSVDAWVYDHNTDRPDYPEQVIRQSNFVEAVAWHCYADNNSWTVLTDFHQKHPHTNQYMTECWLHLADESFFELPRFVLGPLQNWANGALAWTLLGSSRHDVSYPGGCDQCSGLIQVDRTAQTFELTQDYFTMGQLSAFIPRNSIALSTIYTGESLAAQAFIRPDQTHVVVMINEQQTDVSTSVTLASGASWQGLYSSHSKFDSDCRNQADCLRRNTSRPFGSDVGAAVKCTVPALNRSSVSQELHF